MATVHRDASPEVQDTLVRGFQKNMTLRGTIGVIGVVLVWDLIARFGLANPEYFPPLSDVLQALAAEVATPAFWSSLGATLLGWGVGLSIASVAESASDS